jgi:predicted Zn finger-like uncharacterized protein
MRLSCPNCDAEYEVPDGMVPAAGRHVQCTACHTRWFARGTAAEQPSEEQILTRLAARDPRPEPAVAAAAPPAPEAPTPAPVAPVVPLRPAKPSDQPAVPRPADPAAAAPPRPAPRLDLAPPAADFRPVPAPEPAGRFWLGFAVTLLLFLLALGAYDFRQEITADVPGAGPALEAYADTVDDLRDRVERELAPVRAWVDARTG